MLPQSFANDREALARFEREALAVAATSHPSILSIYDFGKQDDTAYAVMELLEGHTLREKLKAGPLPVNLVLHYSLQIVEGLSAAHEKEIVHRDLKPENLFVTKDGRVKILDFGLAKRVERVAPGEETSAPTVEGGQTRAGMVMGTLGYMSPEQLLGQDVDHRTDLFSFGVVLYEMVGRTAPFRGNSAVAISDAILHKQPPELTDKKLPARLKGIIRGLLEKEREKRYETAGELLTELKDLEASLAPGRFRLSPRAKAAAATALVILIAAGAFLWRRESRERWALQKAIPEIARRIEDGQFLQARGAPRRRGSRHPPQRPDVREAVDQGHRRDRRSSPSRLARTCRFARTARPAPGNSWARRLSIDSGLPGGASCGGFTRTVSPIPSSSTDRR